MAGENTVTTANALYKKVYGKKLVDVRPKSSVIQDLVPFSQSQRVGDSYNEGIMLQPPNGFTYNGSAGGVAALNSPANMVSKQASVTPSEINLREQMAYAAMSRAVDQGEAAFKSLTSEVLVGMKAAHHNRVEASALHGQRGYGTVESVTANGSDADVVFTAATFAPGLFWAFGVGSKWDSYTGATKNNASGVLTVLSINAASRLITVSYTGTMGSEIAAGDVFYPQGAYSTADMMGLMSQASNTGSMFGIDAALHSNWKGNSFAIGGPLSYGLVEDCLSQLRDRGADSTLAVLLSNRIYSQLVVELSQLRIISGESTVGKQGFKSISYESPDVGTVQLIKHPFMKQSEGLILPVDNVIRSGSSDVSLGIPGSGDGEVFMYVAGYNAVEVQTFSDQFVLLQKPSCAGIMTGITT